MHFGSHWFVVDHLVNSKPTQPLHGDTTNNNSKPTQSLQRYVTVSIYKGAQAAPPDPD
jgi:hypothetical protein